MIGQHVISTCASQMKKVTCELGGKNALIIMEDADVDVAIQLLRLAHLVPRVSVVQQRRDYVHRSCANR